ncbi:M20 metallopeptidase family protein [Brevibacterium pigmentatum]|uniref:M20 metallopeptidase family protein n=1 Tax=Brevibacterium pigmentatum TaxID=1496080 RepID=UPI00141FAD9D|nr:M20 family metallopeptidase [Brevibacterium pigmentatum]
MIPDFPADAAEILSELQTIRRDLHANPEVGTDLPRTQQAVLDAIDGLDLEITKGVAQSSVVAVLRGGKLGPTVLLRGDMDALPVNEETDYPFASTNGAMHACGHDLHTSGLIGAARLLAAHRDELPGSVIFMFQPNEEGDGGAKNMIDEGMLEAAGERRVAAYAIHVKPGTGGVFTTRPGPLMAGFISLEITMRGAGGHSSQPQFARDPVAPLTELAVALNTMTSRRFDVFDPVVMPVTQLRGSDANNVIPDTASLGACIRYLSPERVEQLRTEVTRIADGIASAHGCRAEITFEPGFPVTTNDTEEAAWTAQQLTSVYGTDRYEEMPNPEMGSEDFSFVINEVPGAYVYLATTPDGVDPEPEDNHSPRVKFDDKWLGDFAAALAHLAFARLAR